MNATGEQRTKAFYQFGPFRIDPEKEVLLRDGQPVALTPKTFQILLVLVRHSNQVVTKDDLMKAVWPDTFVEEANLSRNIFMLRKALGSAESRYIVTVPGRGYRLAETVEVTEEPQEVSIAAAQHTSLQVQVTETRPRWMTRLVMAVLVTVAITATWFYWPRPKMLGEKDKVLLADFRNSTNEPVFDETLRQGLAIQLEQSPYLSLVSEEAIQRTLGLMERARNASLTGPLAREVCERTGAAVVLSGSIASLGSQYVLGLRAMNCRSGEVVDEEQAQAAKKEDVLSALTQIAARFRSKVGESVAAVAQHERPLAEVTTASLDALKAFSTGVRMVSTAPAEAVRFFQRAVELDPNFAIAYAWLARQYGDMNEFGRSAEMAKKAYALRDRTSDPEKFWIEADYETQVAGDMTKAAEVCEVWAKTYPRDPVPDDMLAGIIYPQLARYDAALGRAREALERDREFGVSYPILAARYRTVERLDEAQKTVDDALHHKLVRPETMLEQYNLAFLRQDGAGMERTLTMSQADPVAEEWVTEAAALTSANGGQMRQARSQFARAEQIAQQGGRVDSVALYKATLAVVEAWRGNLPEAQAEGNAALKLSNDAGVEYGAALALAMAGETERAAALADDLERRFAEDSSAKFSYVPVLRAVLALKQSDPSRAIAALRANDAKELASPETALHANFGALYAAYVRGLALLEMNQGAEAATEFAKIAQHPGIVINDPVGVMARLGLGRAYTTTNEGTKARLAYQQFFAFWKNADSDLPLLKQAQSEYAKLQ